ncbi:hypothetical protein MKQ68_18955 [Chitinophaga horti]|uniref:Uncharacterized protein n=1 Tax=Chitinophaga horti TaxID=2920382 RepID=A0ABY6IXZ4_9BACT|nr:hypothetical protein [Chitinophaga horti]UYQ92170.1 hypothetical protein MKQ68_18955 [Chitinophaga horti]
MTLQEMILIDEIVLQTKIAKRAAERLLATHDHSDPVETWCSIQSILGATGNISKILWPTKQKYKERGEKLRKLLSVGDDNPLSSRKFRNHFEHYDERVEEWFENSVSAVYVDRAMNPSLMAPRFFNGKSNVHRGYNSYDHTLVFRGEILDLTELMEALDTLLTNCRL